MSKTEQRTKSKTSTGDTPETTLRGQLLIAMPGLLDPNFSQALVYIIEHSPKEGAMGITINRPLDFDLSQVYEQLELKYSPRKATQTLLCGGPVQEEQGFVLHKPATKEWRSTTMLNNAVCLTTSRDIITDMAGDLGPEQALVALGYSGWASGQLEQELLDNAWLTVHVQEEFLAELLFDTPLEKRASLAAASIGVALSQLSNSTGHA